MKNSIILNRKELQEWLNTAHNCDTSFSEYDGNGNFWSDEIYEKDGKFYSLGCLGGDPCEMVPKKKGEEYRYELHEVKKTTRIVEITDWEYI